MLARVEDDHGAGLGPLLTGLGDDTGPPDMREGPDCEICMG